LSASRILKYIGLKTEGAMRYGLVLALLFGSTWASADEIHLRNGGRLVGDIRERRTDAVVIETGPGLVTVPTAQVARVVTAASALTTYRARAARLRANDVEGWFELALWARDEGLNTQARQALDHVLTIHPNHSGAHQAAGHVFQDGRWMTPEQSYRSRGLVPFEGSWVTPADRLAILTERAAESEERRRRAESEAQVREAEARARVAEAEARRAEAEADAQATDPGGIPYPFVFGGGGGIVIVPDPILDDPVRPLPPIIAPPPHRHPPPRDGNGRSRPEVRTHERGVTPERRRER
jgi:hypothetical protein